MIIRNLTFLYKNKTVYKDFDLKIDEGKVCCVMGSSGGGKTTLLNCISGQLAYSGDIFYGQYADMSIDKTVVSYVFQQPRLIPSLTVEGNIKFVLEKKDKESVAKRVDSIIERMELKDCRRSYPSAISGGQASRTALARALVRDYDVLLLDEPFKGLDIKLKMQILTTLKPLIKGKTVVFVTHDVEEALAMADKIVVLSRKGDEAVNIVDQIVIDENVDDRDLYGANLNDMRKRIMSALTEC